MAKSAAQAFIARMDWGDLDMKRLLLAATCIAMSGCTNLANFNSIHRDVKLQEVGSQLIDAKQRAIIVWPETTTTTTQGQGSTTVKAQTLKVCAEASPDVFSIYAASGELSLSQASGGAGAISGASSESGASLLRRTTTLQALRDAYYRLCEAEANGSIDDVDLMIGQRHNQTSLVGLVAIEQLTGAIAAPTVALGSSAQAVSASAIQAVAGARAAEAKKNVGIKRKISEADESKTTLDARLKAIDADLKKTPIPEPGADALKKEQSDKTTELKDIKETLADLALDLEASDKGLEALTKALDGAAQTGSLASSSPVLLIPQTDPKAQENVAQAVVDIVKMIDDNDFGPTVCLAHLRKIEGGLTVANSDANACRKILAAYIEGMVNRNNTIKSFDALLQKYAAMTPEQLSKVEDAPVEIAKVGRDFANSGSSRILGVPPNATDQ